MGQREEEAGGSQRDASAAVVGQGAAVGRAEVWCRGHPAPSCFLAAPMSPSSTSLTLVSCGCATNGQHSHSCLRSVTGHLSWTPLPHLSQGPLCQPRASRGPGIISCPVTLAVTPPAESPFPGKGLDPGSGEASREHGFRLPGLSCPSELEVVCFVTKNCNRVCPRGTADSRPLAGLRAAPLGGCKCSVCIAETT